MPASPALGAVGADSVRRQAQHVVGRQRLALRATSIRRCATGTARSTCSTVPRRSSAYRRGSDARRRATRSQLDEVGVVHAGEHERIGAFGCRRVSVSECTSGHDGLLSVTAHVKRREVSASPHRDRRAFEQRARRRGLRETRSRRAASARRPAAWRCGRSRARSRRAAARPRASPSSRKPKRRALLVLRNAEQAEDPSAARAGSVMRIDPLPSSLPL